MEAAEQSVQRDLQHVKFCDMKLHATIWSGREGAYNLNGKRKDLVDGAVQLEPLALGLKRDVLERSIGGSTGDQVVADDSYAGVAGFNKLNADRSIQEAPCVAGMRR